MQTRLAKLHALALALRAAARLAHIAQLWRPRRLRRLLRHGFAPALALALLAAPLGAQPTTLAPLGPAGSGFPFVATNPTLDVSLASDADGDFVAAWQQSGDIYYRVYRADGTPRSEPLRANSFFTNTQREPSVAMDADGDFVLAWTSTGQDGDNGEEDNVYVRRFNANGAPLGNELRANSYTSNSQFSPSVAADAVGNFAVAWEGYRDELTSVYVRRFNANGTVRESDDQLVRNTTTAAGQAPSVAMDADGDFVVAWSVPDEVSGVYAQRVRPDGSLVGTVEVTTSDTYVELSPAAAMDADGDFVVAWHDIFSNDELALRRFNRDAVAQGEPIVFGSGSASFSDPAVTMDAAGNFATAWLTSSLNTTVRVQRYAADGSIGQSFAVDTISTFANATPALASDADGEFVVGWERFSTAHGRIYRRPAVLAEQSGGATEVAEGPASLAVCRQQRLFDEVAVALRTIPSATVTLTLAPDSSQIDLGNGPGVPLTFQIEPNVDALEPRLVLVCAVDDDAAEGPHTALIGISASGANSGYNSVPPPLVLVDGLASNSFAVQIADNDTARYFAGVDVAAVAEGGGRQIRFSVRRSDQLGGVGSVGYRLRGTATFGSDYRIVAGASGPEGSLGFAPRESERSITLEIVNDAVSEPNKSIVLELHSPQPQGATTISFSTVTVTLVDDELSEVRIAQSNGRTVVERGGAGDQITVALRTTPIAPVSVTLIPRSAQLNLGAGWGAPRTLTFAADTSAATPQTVDIFTAGGRPRAATLNELATVEVTTASADPSYNSGAARITVDGADRQQLTVEILGDPSLGFIRSIFLPLVRR